MNTKGLFALLSVFWLIGCNSQEAPAPAVSTFSMISKQFQDAWNNCVTGSYHRELDRISDKSAAAESAFSACKSEEDEIVQLDSEHMIPIGVWLHYKSQAKVVLIEKGVVATP